jgi:hypothetical protein
MALYLPVLNIYQFKTTEATHTMTIKLTYLAEILVIRQKEQVLEDYSQNLLFSFINYYYKIEASYCYVLSSQYL